MSLQTIFVTNREPNIGRNKIKRLFGNDIDTSGAIHFAKATSVDKVEKKKRKITNKITRITEKIRKTYELSKIDSEDADQFLTAEVTAYNNGRPWVFFLHGNNQTLSKNLVKSRRIQDEYQVNLVIFSWPSKSYEPYMMPLLLAGGLMAANPPTKLIGKWVAKKAIKRKIRQYKRARRDAEKTAPALNQAFKQLREKLFVPLKQKGVEHTCFLTHSLGHYVLRNAVEDPQTELKDFQFDTCMLHQADEHDANHLDWIGQFQLAANDKTYITRNKKDAVLLLSGVVNNDFNVMEACSRLGNRWDNDNEQDPPLKYIDFTGLDDVGLGHGIAWDEGRSSEVDDLCKPVIAGG